MSETNDPSVRIATVARRQLFVGMAVAFGSLAAGYKVWSKPQQEAMKQQPSTVANQQRTSLHQETDLRATPKRIYELLLDSKQFAAFTGVPAEIDPTAGGAFSPFGGLIDALVGNELYVSSGVISIT